MTERYKVVDKPCNSETVPFNTNVNFYCICKDDGTVVMAFTDKEFTEDFCDVMNQARRMRDDGK